MNLTFKKSGKEIKVAINHRIAQLQMRLSKRDEDLNLLIQDTKRLRSYLVRSADSNFYGHGQRSAPLFSKDDISSEEKEEIQQMCRRIFEIEQEVKKLELTRAHLIDEQEFDLSFGDLVAYGFEE